MRRVAAWVGVTVAAFLLVGGALHFPGTLDDVGLEPGPLILGGLTGLLIGAAQLFALRGVLSRPWLWPGATAIGMAITHAMGDGVSTTTGYVPVAVVGGFATGVLQAAVLRRPLWAVATAGAFVIGIAGGYALAFAMGFNSIFSDDTNARYLILLGLTSVLYALFTAPLFAQIRPEERLPILASDGAA
ncbi:MAG: hypothetical protein M3P16_08980 [Chloroflexota bacterium]|nr:hypothetical protein [Chloroflexota bacterium]